MSRTDRARLSYEPALDGLRGVAVAAVLLFHGGFAWARGGFLGVSTFFTLSGFLITSLLLVEHRGSGRIDLSAFWERRFRRLLPAALATLAFAILLALTVLPEARAGLTGDVLAALCYVANWHFWIDGSSYANLFSAPSPVLHFWSLAIEEQFYLVFPLVVALTLRRERRGRPQRLLAVVTVGIIIGITVLRAASRTGAETFAYYATVTRMPELLMGAALACLVGTGWLARFGLSRPGTSAPPAAPLRRITAVAGVAGLVALALFVHGVDRTSAWLAAGGFPVVALCSVLVIAATLVPGPVRRVLSFEPLRLLGVVSYGVYLWHWPVFVWLTQQRVGVGGWPLFALRLAVTAPLVAASWFLLERPIRSRRWFPKARQALVAGPIGAAGVVALVVLTTTGATAKAEDPFAAARAMLAATPAATASANVAGPALADGATSTAVPATAVTPTDGPPTSTGTDAPGATAVVSSGTTPTTAAPAAPVKAGMFGDSTALMTATGLRRWGFDTGRMDLTAAEAIVGCGLGRDGERRYHYSGGAPVPDKCRDWPTAWPAVVHDQQMQVAVVQEGPWEAADAKLPNDSVWRHLGDPVYDDYVRKEIDLAVTVLEQAGARVVWLTAPDIQLGRTEQPPPAQPYQASDPARMQRFNQLLAEVAGQHPAMRVVDLAGYLRSLPGGELDPRLRPDGVHFTIPTAIEVAQWLGPAILDAAGFGQQAAGPVGAGAAPTS